MSKNKSRIDAGRIPSRDSVIVAAQKLAQVEQRKQDGKLRAARRDCEALLREAPYYVAALKTHGLICLDLGKFEDAYNSLCRANDFFPNDPQTLIALGRTQFRMWIIEPAITNLELALRFEPGTIAALETLAEIYMATGEFGGWERALRELVEKQPDNPERRIALSACLQAMGRNSESIPLLKSVVRENHMSSSLLFAISLYGKDPGVIDMVETTDNIDAPDRSEDATYDFIRANALHWAGRADEAWQLLCLVNAAVAAAHLDSWNALAPKRERDLRRAQEFKFPNMNSNFDSSKARPVFLLGESRSGKSSLECLLGALPGVYRGHEKHIVPRALFAACAKSRCKNVSKISNLPNELGGEFTKQFRASIEDEVGANTVFATTQGSLIVDALWLKRYIPESRFVIMKRDRWDVMFRMFLMNYREGAGDMAFSYDLKSIENYLNWYDQLADICVEKLGDSCIEVSYEEMVEDPSATLTIVARHCGIEAMPTELPPIGDDRGVSIPYREWMRETLES